MAPCRKFVRLIGSGLFRLYLFNCLFFCCALSFLNSFLDYTLTTEKEGFSPLCRCYTRILVKVYLRFALWLYAVEFFFIFWKIYAETVLERNCADVWSAKIILKERLEIFPFGSTFMLVYIGDKRTARLIIVFFDDDASWSNFLVRAIMLAPYSLCP